MKRADDVFFFTLIDFLLQVFFFGLLLYVLSDAGRADDERVRAAEVAEIERAKAAAGVSSLSELTDELSKLAPLEELRGMFEFIRDGGGLQKVKDALKVVDGAGGTQAVTERLARLQKLEQGTGKPPCVFDVVDGKRVIRSIGRVEVTDTHVTFRERSPELDGVLANLGTTYEEIQTLPLMNFRRRFTPLRSLQCLYRLDVNLATPLIAPMDAVWWAFSARRL